MTIYRYSKSSSFYADTKRSFFEENERHLEIAQRINALYIGQPQRTNCKLCACELPKASDFVSHKVPYAFCVKCGHLNGMHEDTLDFCNAMYIADGGGDYAKTYIDSSYTSRMTDIYLPKMDFLIQTLPANPRYKYLDVGCGAGYLVAAGLARNVDIVGADVGEQLVTFGNTQISHLYDRTPLSFVEEDEFYAVISSGTFDVITAIGVIEHLRNPDRFFEAFRKGSARYLCFSVPMFSMSVVFEHALQSVFPRQLSAGHTHLFTESSLETMKSLLAANAIAEWRFGADAMDLLRFSLVSIEKGQGSNTFTRMISDNLSPMIDELQSVMDRFHFCSEIHCVLEKV